MIQTPLPSIPWTRLKVEPIFSAARLEMSSNASRYYHNFNHVIRMYRHAAETFGFSYDRALDLAILTHDVVFDSSGDRELRSIKWLRDHLPLGEKDPDFEVAATMIETTIEHRLTEDPRLVLLDMADFIDPEVSDANTELLRKEALALHSVQGPGFAITCERYLGEMKSRFKEGASNLSPSLRYIHEDICHGICRTQGKLHMELQSPEMESGHA